MAVLQAGKSGDGATLDFPFGIDKPLADGIIFKWELKIWPT
ncbi:hypothetical protein [uncultured Pseudacidovorax sp.]|nr:hypothetical protein [uncultured Pseudacidovorax sp.]